MLDIGWTEMAFIAVIALIVIGPKDLPKAMRTVSHWVRKARSLAREFQSGLEEIAQESEIKELKEELTGGGDFDLKREIENTIDPTGSVDEVMDLSEEMAALDSTADRSATDPQTPTTPTPPSETPSENRQMASESSEEDATTKREASA